MKVGIVANQEARHDSGYSMGCVIFGILTATCRVVVFDKILKDVGKEIVMLGKRFLKREVGELVNHGTGKWRTLCNVRNILC